MKLIPLAANVCRLDVGPVSVLFSYQTPVGLWYSEGAFQLANVQSVTAAKHRNAYATGEKVGAVDFLSRLSVALAEAGGLVMLGVTDHLANDG